MSSTKKSIEKSSSTKRRRFDVETKITILKQAKDGKSPAELSSIHKIKIDTIRHIIRAENKLMEKINHFVYPDHIKARKS
jgi:hypothetical protein